MNENLTSNYSTLRLGSCPWKGQTGTFFCTWHCTWQIWPPTVWINLFFDNTKETDESIEFYYYIFFIFFSFLAFCFTSQEKAAIAVKENIDLHPYLHPEIQPRSPSRNLTPKSDFGLGVIAWILSFKSWTLIWYNIVTNKQCIVLYNIINAI